MATPYKETEQVQKKDHGSRQPEKSVHQPVEQKIEEKQEVVTPVVEKTPVEPVKVKVMIETKAKDLLAGVMEKKPRAKSYGFYLDDEVVAALEKLARQNKSSKSKVWNKLHRNMLLK